ncbi:MAG: PAS domain S-box protein [Thermoplasmata archaeon]
MGPSTRADPLATTELALGGPTFRDYQAFLKSILESSTEYSIIAVDLDGRVQVWNEGARRTYGYIAAEIVGQDASILYAFEDATSGLADQLAQKTLSNGSWEGELRRRRKNGAEFPARVTMTVRRDALGEPEGFLIVSKDVTSEKELYAKLAASEEYNRLLVEASIDSQVVLDPLGVITDLNRRAEGLTGRPRSDSVGTSFYDYCVEPSRAKEMVGKALAVGRVANVEFTMRARSGEETVVSFNAGMLRGPHGGLRGVLVTGRDVTEHRRLESQLRESQTYNRRLFESSVDALVSVDLVGNITDLNHPMERMTGHLREELIGSAFAQHFESPKAAMAGIEKALREGSVANLELVLRSRDGQSTPVSLSVTALRDSNDRLRGVLVAARDVSERRRAERTTTLLAAIVGSSDDAIISKDLQGVITSWNFGAERLFGYTSVEAVGQPITLIIPQDRRAEEEQILQRLRAGERVEHFETVRQRKDGKRLDISLTISPLRDVDGRVIGASKVARDVTEQRRIMNELEEQNRELEVQNRRVEEANRMKSEFLAGMSHELRTPLNSIIGFSEFMFTEPDSNLTDDQREFLGHIYNSGNHLLQLINDILDISRVEAGRIGLVMEPFSPSAAVDEVCSVTRPLLEKKQVTLATHIDASLETVTLDRLRFNQILYNLLSNAAKFTHAGGHIEVGMAPLPPDRFALRIQDTGIGISPEDIPRLFRQFEQLEAGASRRYQGSGLGLYLTKKLIDAHGGSIRVESAVGKGTTFTVILPTRADLMDGRETSPTQDA